MHLLAEAMSLRGHQVYAIDYQSMWQQGGDGLGKEFISSRTFQHSVIHLLRPWFIKIVGLGRISAFATHFFEIRNIIKKKAIDAIVLYSVPTNGLQSIYWARKFDIPVVFRSIDVLNRLVPHAVLRPITKWLEGKVYSSVDGILTITPKLSEYVISLGANLEKVKVLPMTVDTNLFCPSNNVGEMKRKWGLSDNDKIVLFMGTLFSFSGLDWLIYHFSQIVRVIPEAKLLIVGDGPQRKRLEKIICLLGLQGKVIITGFQPYQDMPQYINLADVCVNTFVSNPITKDIFPGKTVQFLACGKPLVMRPLDGVKAVIEGEEQGVIYADTDNRMVGVISSLLESSEKREKLGQNGLKYAREFHSCEKVAEQLETELFSLIEGEIGSVYRRGC